MGEQVWEALLLAATLSVDGFLACLAYGSSGIRVPFRSVLAVDLVCAGVLGGAVFLGDLVRPFLSPGFCTSLCFFLLFIMGLSKLLDEGIKSLLRRNKGLSKKIGFSLFHLNFVLGIYADPEQADADASKVISLSEAVSLAAALSLDGVGVGFGAALGHVNGLWVVLSSLLIGALFLPLGTILGRRLSSKLPFNLSWLSGVVLLVLAVGKVW